MDYHSIVLMASCDSGYKFTSADVGSEGRNNDGSIFKTSKIGMKLLSGKFELPPAEFVKNGPFLPYFFVGDAAFALSEFMMTPFGMLELKLFSYSTENK